MALGDFLSRIFGPQLPGPQDPFDPFNTAEFGDTINLRRPVYLASSSGAVIGGSDTSNIEEGKVAVVVDQREKVVFELSSKELALNVTSRRAEQYIDAMADELLNKI